MLSALPFLNSADFKGISRRMTISVGTGALDTELFGKTHGEIVGSYTDSNGTDHGFTLIAGNFATVDPANSFFTDAIRVNAAGQIVGSYFLSGRHGFLATPIPSQKP
jgi:hypothetical protein